MVEVFLYSMIAVLVAAELIGLDSAEIEHIHLASSEQLGKTSLQKIDIVGQFEANKTIFKPAHLDWMLKGMNYLTRYKVFVYYVLQNNLIFKTAKVFVQLARKLRLAG